MDIKEIFGKNLKRLRTEIDYTQEELAEKIGLQSQSISNLESGKFFISHENLEVLCRFFDVHPMEFFLEINKNSNLKDKEKIDAIHSIISNSDSELLDNLYKMIIALR